MEPIRLLIVDDEPLFRELLYHALSANRELELVGMAGDGESAIHLTREMNPGVVLMDIELPGELDGIDTALQIKKERPQTGIVFLSIHKDRRYFTSLPLEDCGGWAYLLKQTVPDVGTLLRTVEGANQGMLVMDPELVSNLRPRQGSLVERLTQRKREVMELIAQGYNNAGIADRLGLSEKSVETYINKIYQELNISKEPDKHARVKATLIYLQDEYGRE